MLIVMNVENVWEQDEAGRLVMHVQSAESECSCVSDSSRHKDSSESKARANLAKTENGPSDPHILFELTLRFVSPDQNHCEENDWHRETFEEYESIHCNCKNAKNYFDHEKHDIDSHWHDVRPVRDWA